MCGRFTQLRPWSELVELYRITFDLQPLNIPARYNVAPSQDVPVVRQGPALGQGKDGGSRELRLMRWGLVPSWAKDIKIGYRTINARAETVHMLPAFRAAFRQRRCLVVADGFYEWRQQPAGAKQPYYITLPERRPFAFAGLWEQWRDAEGRDIESCTIIVTAASEALRPIHDRMPVILEPDAFDLWLDTGRSLEETRTLFAPYGGELAMWPVSRTVNSVRNDVPDCIAPVGPPVGPQLTGHGDDPAALG